MEELFYRIALTRAEFIGNKTARLLLSKFGSAEAVFNVPEKQLNSIEGLGKERVRSLKRKIDKAAVEKELDFIHRHQIQPLFINDSNYPKLLKECPDAPVMLYFKGSTKLNFSKKIAIVGTRSNTDYGRQMVEDLIAGCKDQIDLAIISGLAFGIDAIAHKTAVKHGLPTIGVLGHGLDRIYPAQNRKLAGDMLLNGGLLTEYPSGTNPDKQNFPQRNRIVAGMADVIVVVETGEKGGSMITAKLACSYNREVVAFPGRSIDNHSAGCNYLIKTNIAGLISNAADLLELMNWKAETGEKKVIQRKLFETLTPEEKTVIDKLSLEKEIHVDELTLKTGMQDSALASVLLSLELEGLVRSLPGKRYRLS